MRDFLLTEKWRPTTLDGYVFQDEIQEAQVRNWIKEGEIPHLLLSGSPGVGKTTLAKVLINELGVVPQDVLELNASRTNRIDDVRDQIISFISCMPFGEFRIVLLDEADYMSRNAQGALRGVLEEYASVARFIFTCNYPNKIISALHSRCQVLHIGKLNKDQFMERVATILVAEDIKVDLDTLDSYVAATYPDLRKCLNSIQQNTIDGELKKPGDESASTEDYKVRIVDLFKDGKIIEARKLLIKSVSIEEIEDTFRWMYNNLELWSSSQEGQDKAIKIIRDGLVNHAMVADPEINLSATLVELTTIEE